MQSYLPVVPYYPQEDDRSVAHVSEKLKKAQPPSISDVFKKIIAKYEIKKPQNINAIQISKTYKIQHRRVYDLFNFITSFGVCKVIERRRVGWVGLEQFEITLAQKYEEIERQSLTKPIKELFSLGPSPSLGVIGSKLLCLFLYLGADCLSMRSISAIFHDNNNDIKSLERRIYLVISFLEIVGKITKGKNRGEYIIKVDTNEIVHKGFQARFEEAKVKNPTSIDSLVATDGLAYRYYMYHKRRLEFQSVIGL